MENLYFVSGLPRSGSTLLMNFLGQNPNHHVTPTSGLIELFCTVKSRWKDFIEFKAEGLDVVQPRIESTLKGILYGYFEKELAANKVCFDKSRGWLQYIEDVEKVLGRKIQIIVTIRDIRSILASFEKIYRNRGIDYQYPLGDAFFQAQTLRGRSEILLSPGGVVGITIDRLRDALARLPNRLVIVPYHHLTNSPKDMIENLHKALNLPNFEYDPDNVKQVTHENDVWHGMNLHKINGVIKPQKPEPWRGIVPDDYAAELAERYADIHRMLT